MDNSEPILFSFQTNCCKCDLWGWSHWQGTLLQVDITSFLKTQCDNIAKRGEKSTNKHFLMNFCWMCKKRNVSGWLVEASPVSCSQVRARTSGMDRSDTNFSFQFQPSANCVIYSKRSQNLVVFSHMISQNDKMTYSLVWKWGEKRGGEKSIRKSRDHPHRFPQSPGHSTF